MIDQDGQMAIDLLAESCGQTDDGEIRESLIFTPRRMAPRWSIVCRVLSELMSISGHTRVLTVMCVGRMSLRLDGAIDIFATGNSDRLIESADTGVSV